MTLQAFFDEYKQGTIENPIGANRVWNWEALFYVTPFQGKAHVQDLQSLKPKSGAGSKAMSWLVGLADKHGVTLTLFASPTPRAKTNISLPKLKKFYGKFGFKAKGGDDLMERLPVPIAASLSAVADAAAHVIHATKVAKKVKAAVEEAAFYVALSAMTEAQAKQVLGFPASANPSPMDVKRAWQKAAMKYHPDRGGDPAMMVEVNVAKDILDGTRKPDKTYGPTTAPKQPPPPGPSSYKPPPPPPKEEKVSKTAQAAAQEAGVLNSPWLGFFKQKAVGYSGDESSNWTHYFVAVAPDKDPTKVTLGMFIHYERDNGINGGASDVWEVKTVRVFKNEAAITKGVKMAYEAVAKKFGTSTPHAQTSRFHVTANLPESLPEVLQKNKIILPTVSMAELLQALGLTASEKAKKATPKKSVVEILFRRQPPSPEDGTSIRLLGLRLNGADPFWFTQEETVKFKLARGLTLVFGEYLYDDNVKVLSRITKRSAIASWLLKHTSMPEEYTSALQAIVDAATTA